LDSLKAKEGFSIHFFHRVMDLRRDGKLWNVRIRNGKTGEHWDRAAKFVFIGAGGGSLPLLQKSGIPEGRGDAGFPGGGGWVWWGGGVGRWAPLRCSLPATTPRYMAKRRSAHRRCPYRIWTRVTSKVKFLCCSGLTQDFRRSFSSMDRIWICSAPSIRKIYCRCWPSV